MFGEDVGQVRGILAGLDGRGVCVEEAFPEVHVWCPAQGGVLERVLSLLGSAAYGVGDDPLEKVTGGLLVARGMTLAAAESCTGGLVGHLVTNVSGSSSYFTMGVTTYSNESKNALLGVSWDDLQVHGAVSEPVVRQMAVGVRRLSGADVSVATSGIAGPTGGTKDKPVGTVWMAVAGPAGCHSRLFRLDGDRLRIKTLSAYNALNLVRLAVIGEIEGVVG